MKEPRRDEAKEKLQWKNYNFLSTKKREKFSINIYDSIKMGK